MWQAQQRAKPSGERHKDDGVFGVQFAGHEASIYWCGFVPLKPLDATAAAGAADAGAASAPQAAGRFCVLELCRCNLATADGILLYIRALYLISLSYPASEVHTEPPKTEDALTAMLSSLKQVAAASVTPPWMKPVGRSSSSDEGSGEAVPVNMDDTHIIDALTTAVGAKVLAGGTEVLYRRSRGTLVVRVSDLVVKIERCAGRELDMLERVARAKVPHVMLPLRTYRDLPSGGSTVVFPLMQPCPLRLTITEFASFAFPLLKVLVCFLYAAVSFACVLCLA